MQPVWSGAKIRKNESAVARRDFITRLLGYFADERMGFIQTPHSFYNFDNFHGTLDYKKKRYWEEGELFYNGRSRNCIQEIELRRIDLVDQ